jgi:Zn-dependent protease
MRLNKQELEDLAISYFVLLLLFSNFNIKVVPYVALAVLTAFVFHELAHRQVAKKYGYVAFYKRWDTGIMIALLLGILGKAVFGKAIVFAALGAVYIYAPYQYWEDKEAEGRISFSGPLTNIVIGIVAVLILKTMSLPLVATFALYYTAAVNFWLAFFNLLPIPPLDGYKVLRWNTAYWALGVGFSYLMYSLL